MRSTLRVGIVLLVAATLLHAQATTQPTDLAGKSFQIQNVEYARLLRPRDASNKDGTPLVLYPHEDWKCMTWKLEPAGDGVRLMNYFTHKTLQPKGTAADDKTSDVDQQPEAQGDSPQQQWKFVPIEDGFYKIENVQTGQVLGADADENVVTGKYTGAKSQKWKLLPKPEKFTG